MNLEKLIKEEIEKYLNEQNPDMQQTIISNVNKHIRILKILKSILKQIKMPPEFEKMSQVLNQENTPEFLSQFLKINKSIPVNISSVLTSPIELINSVIDEILNTALKNANKKLSQKLQEKEGDLPFLLRDPKAKHEKEIKKKKGYQPPPPVL